MNLLEKGSLSSKVSAAVYPFFDEPFGKRFLEFHFPVGLNYAPATF